MIDFQNATFAKLKPVDPNAFWPIISPTFTADEQIIAAYQGIRDGVVFSNKRIISINIQGITGKKKDITSMPYNKIQVYSVETAGTFDFDSELELWFSGVGKVKFEFSGNVDISAICKTISGYVLR